MSQAEARARRAVSRGRARARPAPAPAPGAPPCLVLLQAALLRAGSIRAANGSFQSFLDQELHVLLQALKRKQRSTRQQRHCLEAKGTVMHRKECLRVHHGAHSYHQIRGFSRSLNMNGAREPGAAGRCTGLGPRADACFSPSRHRASKPPARGQVGREGRGHPPQPHVGAHCFMMASQRY